MLSLLFAAFLLQATSLDLYHESHGLPGAGGADESEQAIELYEIAAGIEPDHVENDVLLAKPNKPSDNKKKAEEAEKAVLRIGPTDAQANDPLRALKKAGDYQLSKRIGEMAKFAAFFSVIILLFFAYRSRRRMPAHGNRLYHYFTNILLPPPIFLTFLLLFGKNRLSQWFDTALIGDITEALLFFALGASFFALSGTERKSQDIAKTVVLAIGAHPDDIEIGCGGFITKLKDSGAFVYALTMTKGEKGTERRGRREGELRRAARFMRLDDFWVMDFPDTGLKDSIPQMKDVIEEKIKATGATMVLTHSSIDIHSDHRAVFEASREAARNISILNYEDVSTPREFVPNYLIDISDYIEDKLKLIKFHKTQKKKTYMDPEVIKGRAAHRGIQGGVRYAEAYRIDKLLR